MRADEETKRSECQMMSEGTIINVGVWTVQHWLQFPFENQQQKL